MIDLDDMKELWIAYRDEANAENMATFASTTIPELIAEVRKLRHWTAKLESALNRVLKGDDDDKTTNPLGGAGVLSDDDDGT